MIVTSPDNSLFITGFDVDTNKITFRTSRNPERIQSEVVKIDRDMAYAGLYNFRVGYIHKFLHENEIPKK